MVRGQGRGCAADAGYPSAAARGGIFQDGIEVEEEDEPAPKRKKKTSVAAREWEHKFALLEAFRRRDGHADVPPGYKVGGTKLRAWLDNQRERCGRRASGARPSALFDWYLRAQKPQNAPSVD